MHKGLINSTNEENNLSTNDFYQFQNGKGHWVEVDEEMERLIFFFFS